MSYAKELKIAHFDRCVLAAGAADSHLWSISVTNCPRASSLWEGGKEGGRGGRGRGRERREREGGRGREIEG